MLHSFECHFGTSAFIGLNNLQLALVGPRFKTIRTENNCYVDDTGSEMEV